MILRQRNGRRLLRRIGRIVQFVEVDDVGTRRGLDIGLRRHGGGNLWSLSRRALCRLGGLGRGGQRRHCQKRKEKFGLHVHLLSPFAE